MGVVMSLHLAVADCFDAELCAQVEARLMNIAKRTGELIVKAHEHPKHVPKVREARLIFLLLCLKGVLPSMW